jgi:hypothetical protein
MAGRGGCPQDEDRFRSWSACGGAAGVPPAVRPDPSTLSGVGAWEAPAARAVCTSSQAGMLFSPRRLAQVVRRCSAEARARRFRRRCATTRPGVPAGMLRRCASTASATPKSGCSLTQATWTAAWCSPCRTAHRSTPTGSACGSGLGRVPPTCRPSGCTTCATPTRPPAWPRACRRR